MYKEGGTVCDLVSGDQEERCPGGQCTKRGVQYVIWYQEERCPGGQCTKRGVQYVIWYQGIRRRGVQMVSVQRGGYSM